MGAVSEDDLEQATLTWFGALGYEVLESDNLAPDSVYRERDSVEDVILKGRLEAALHRLNPDVPVDAIEEAMRRVHRHDAPTLEQNNFAFHRMLVDGIEVEVAREGGGPPRGVLVRLFDFDDPSQNDWMVTSQVTYVDRRTGTGQPRIPDVVVYVNGLPLAVVELKNPASPNADVWDAYQQIQTYKVDVPALFVANAALVVSDDVHARIGSLTADDSRFAVWRTVSGEGDEPAHAQVLKVLVFGVFDKARFSDWLRNFVTFEHEQGRLVKKVAGYHQFHAVRRAVQETVRASSVKGDRRIGVIWHTQGSGKSLSMVFYARKLVVEPAMENPTIVVLTDRNDLDDQLFGTFSQAQALLRQEPKGAASRAELRELLNVASGGVFFTTVQKFLPEPGERHPALSDRRNIVVIADEAHRSQYGFKGRVDTKSGEMVYGFAKHMRDALPDASFIGFTGTPVELEDKSTAQVFGDTISVYDMRRAVEDHATVPITYENRLAKIDLDEAEKPKIDPAFEELTEAEEAEKAEALKSEWATVEALVGTEKRLALVAADIVAHFEKRQGDLEGKALIVCMSRRICVDLYEQIRKLRPDWHDDDDDAGTIKVVMTGSASDDARYQPHLRSKTARRRMQDRYKDKTDPLKLVIVRDMWLTGFDAPCMHTLYVDKPMRGHNLMQAIARVNRVFGDKPGGLVVDYIGLATSLREAMKTYSSRGGTGDATERQEAAAELMLEKLEVCRDVFHGFDYAGFFSAPPAERLELLPRAREHVLAQRKPTPAPEAKPKGKAKPAAPAAHVGRDGYDVFLDAVTKLSSAFALASPHEACDEVRDEVAFFQAVKVGLVKLSTGRRAPSQDLGHAVRQIVSNAVVTGDVLDVFDAAGLPKPDISILSPEFLAEVAGMKHRNLAAALLQRLLEDEVRSRGKKSVVQEKKFSEMLEAAILRYQNRSIESAQVIEELIELARKMREADAKGEALALTKDEAAFYEALAENESAVSVLGDKQLCEIARELTRVVKANTSIDWTSKASVQAKLRLAVKGILKKTGYPPDGQEKATLLVLEQAKALGINLSGVPSNDEAEGVSSMPPSTRARPMPYPIAVFDSLVQSQTEATLRVKTYRDGFEKALTFLSSIALGLVTAESGGKMPDAAFALLQQILGKPISMGTWHELAWRLAAMVPASSSDPAARALRALVTLEGKPSALMNEVMTEVVQERNVFSHSVTPSSEELAQAEPALMDLWRRFKKAVGALTEARLVVRAQLLDFDDAQRIWQYRARILEGGSDLFKVLDVAVPGEMKDRWCYLLRDGAAPLSLAPLVFCAHSEKTSRHEVFVARKLASLEPGGKVDGVGVASTATMRVG